MFNENSVQQEMPAGGSEIRETRAPIRSVMDQSNTETPEPSVSSGVTGLAWWDDMKFYWRRNASGNGSHLAPQDSYVNDVLTEGDTEIQAAAKDFLDEKSDDAAQAERLVELVTEATQILIGLDSSGVEANALVRFFRDRSIIARKITGASAVSANHRLQHAHATTGDTDAARESDYFKSDIENCRRWAFKSCLHEYVANAFIGDYPNVFSNFPQRIADGVRRSLYDDAVEKGNKLKRPAPAKVPQDGGLSAEELRQLRA